MKRPTVLLRIVSTCLLAGLLVGAGVLGCTKGPVKDETGDPAAFALDIKTQATEFLNLARTNPKSAAESVGSIIEALEDYQSRPVGQHKQIYADLLAGCQELKRMYEQSAPATQVNPKIDELLALAGKLPGEVEQEKEGGGQAEVLNGAA